jgi:hypothetical protein
MQTFCTVTVCASARPYLLFPRLDRWFLVEKKNGPCELCNRPGSIIYRPLRAHTHTVQQNAHAKVPSEILTRVLAEILLCTAYLLISSRVINECWPHADSITALDNASL